ncbi:hypothetical protein [Microbacterium sp. SORGH_AS_0888]|uniref:hypothetical protein n=1 Tax=Microbacterium sp. SORGH_AS_0888 TaxID=3041791 RepID=UPI002789D0FB|nr:hypothetical protein [Microbacterium sp. SORGH_AS_0888]MDQ1128780.1 hypothetical protein [Microbacterium sp. SORGH_AS_0888]
MPAIRKRPPSTISGPAQGVVAATGQVIETVAGAGAVPSEATSTLIPAGICSRCVSAVSAEYSPSQRSEPAGVCTAVASAVAAPDCVGSVVAAASSSGATAVTATPPEPSALASA